MKIFLKNHLNTTKYIKNIPLVNEWGNAYFRLAYKTNDWVLIKS